MDIKEIKKMNTTLLAYMGDAIYEVAIREHVLAKGVPHIDAVHKETVKYVKGESQAKILKHIIHSLVEEEMTLVKRARNRKTISKPKNIDPVTYKLATAFEALIGYLYMTKQEERLKEILALAIKWAEAQEEDK